jgi:hypothetical protein
MQPQSGAPAPGSADNYDFILSPDQQKRGGFGFSKDPFITKIVFLVGGALLLMVLVGVIVSSIFGGKTGVETFVALAQRDAEISRISALGTSASSQDIKNAAISTQVSMNSHQNKLVAYLASHDRTVATEELALKKDVTVDSKLEQAKKTSTFDAAYTEIMRGQLTAYAGELKKTYDGKSNGTQREILAQLYRDVQLLLKTWPEGTATQ